jgi:hypothetical protein
MFSFLIEKFSSRRLTSPFYLYINQLLITIDKASVYCEVGIYFLCIIYGNFRLWMVEEKR